MAGMVKRADFLENEVVDLTEEIKLVSPTDTPLTTLLMGRGQVVPANDIKTILTVDLAEVQIAELRGTFYEDLPKAGDYYRGHVLNESTIKLLNSFAGSKISITEAGK